MSEEKKTINADSIKRKINAIRNEKLKLALRLQLQTGLRVKEISELQKEDIKLKDGKIFVHVKYGKGKGEKENEPNPRDVTAREDNYLYDRLGQLMESSSEENLFYSKDYIRHKAEKYGIETHDLRRINAQERFEDLTKSGFKRMEAKEIIREQLGHTDMEYTNLYLNKKKIAKKSKKVKK